MSLPRLFAAVAVASLSIVFTVLWPEQARMHAADLGKFNVAGQAYVEASEVLTFTLEQTEIRQMGDRLFLVGREVVNPAQGLSRSRYSGGTVWLPIDSIRVFVELPPVNK